MANKVKALHLCFIYLVFCIAFLSNSIGIANASSINPDLSNLNLSLVDKINSVSICKWKNDAKTCLSLSFDDNNLSHNKIARILDEHGFKATFVVIAGSMYKDSLRLLIKNGHEVGSHTVSHPDLTTLDSSQVDYQLSKSKELIETTFGKQCVTFAEPGHLKTEQSTRIAFRKYLFVRNYSEYPTVQRTRWAFSQITSNLISLADLAKEIRGAMKTGYMFVLNGHGLGNEGYIPSTPELISTTCDTIKKYSDKGELWVAPMREAGQYENLFHELKLIRKLYGDTLKLSLSNYQKDKYIILDSSMISIRVPKTLSGKIKPISNGATFKENSSEFIVTFDLKKDTTCDIILNLPPIAIAGSSQTVDECSNVILDGSSTIDIEGDSIYYKWTTSNQLKINNDANVKASFVAPEVSKDVTYTVTLTAYDLSSSASTTDQIQILVKQVNKKPVARVNQNLQVTEQSWVPLNGFSSYDADGDKLTYNWIIPNKIEVFDNKTPYPYFLSPWVDEDTNYKFGLVVSDGKLFSDTTWTIVTVNKTRAYFSPIKMSDDCEKMYIDVDRATIDGLDLVKGDEIAVFKGGACVGSNIVRFNNGASTLMRIIVYADSDEESSFNGEKPLRFMIYDSRRKREYPFIDIFRKVDLTYGTGLIFESGITQVVDLFVLNTSLKNQLSLTSTLGIKSLSNPFKDNLRITLESNIEQSVKVELFDEVGRCLGSYLTNTGVGIENIVLIPDKRLMNNEICFLNVNSKIFKVLHVE
jgi:peptidoglycan/xylan/chitin deacetylase (PgdA/CDA1 family)